MLRKQMQEEYEEDMLLMNGGVGYIGKQPIDYDLLLRNEGREYYIWIFKDDVCIKKPVFIKGQIANKYWATNDKLRLTRDVGEIELEEVVKLLNKDWHKSFKINPKENNIKYVDLFKKELVRLLEEKKIIVYGKARFDTKNQFYEYRLKESYEIK